MKRGEETGGDGEANTNMQLGQVRSGEDRWHSNIR